MNDLASRLTAAGLDWIVADAGPARGVRAFVTTRNGGACGDARATLDLGPARLASLEPAVRACIEENRRRVDRFLPSPPVWLEQVHGRDVVRIGSGNVEAARRDAPVADAAVTRLAGVALAVRVADCLPIVLADDEGRVVGLAHAGWRGLAAGVVEATVDAMAVDPGAIHAWLGPCIGRDAFEVGDDVRDALDGGTADAARFRALPARGQWLADLAGLAHDRLARAGVAQVIDSRACTLTDRDRFFSWRRDRSPARFGAFAWRERD